jgi:hypothetical protein
MIKEKIVGKCLLCLQEKELQPKSHIIPDFFYRESDLFHPKYHNLVTISLNSLKNGLVKIIFNKQKTGYYDQNIICFDCEQRILGVYETYGRSFFYSKSIPIQNRLIINDCIDYTECLNCDYQKIKILFLSILWRAGISKQRMFDHVRLEQEQQEEIRRMVLEGNPKTDKDFPIVFLCSLTDKSISRDHLFQPIRIKSPVNDSYNFFFCFGGFVVIFSEKTSDIPESLMKYQVFENGTFRTRHLFNGQTWNMIEKLYISLGRNKLSGL